MPNVFNDEIVRFNQYDFDTSKDVFKQILESRKRRIDSERFFLQYIPIGVIEKYDFNDKVSLDEFRDVCTSFVSPLVRMAGCNLREDKLEQDIRYAGIKISDPSKNILGQFDIRNHCITYSPIFPFFYEERDLVKFARDSYFTTLTFEQLIMNQINNADKYYVHIGNYKKLKDISKYGSYIMEEIDRDEMIRYASQREKGEKVFKKCFHI